MPRVSARRILPVFLVIAGLTFLAYTPAMRAGFIWDDDDYVTENPLLLDGAGLVRIWTTASTPQYYPMVFTTFWIEHKLWGLDATGYHVVNVALHALNAFLIGCILRRLSVPGAWWIAVLFAVHPVQVESVAWITERKNLLSGLFYLLSFLGYLRFDREGKYRFYLLSLVLFLAALLSKTVTASLPVALALALLWSRGKLERRELLRLVPYLALGAGLALITVRLEGAMVGVVGTDFEFAWWQRVEIASRALLFYPAKILFPYPLMFNYPRWQVEGVSVWSLLAPAVVLAGAVALVLAWRRGQRGIVLAILFYAVTIFPALGFLDVYPFRYSFVADHFQYLACVGTLIVAVAAALALGRRLRARPAALVGLRTAAVLLVGALALLTWKQSLIYRDLPTLWQETIAQNPRSWLALNNLGLIYKDSGEYDKALELLDRAIEIKPSSTESFTARGLVHRGMGDADAAMEDLDRAVELDPAYPLARLNRGELLLDLGRGDLAIDDLEVFLAANPDYLPARRMAIRALVETGRHEAALEHLNAIVRMRPDYQAYLNRGVTLGHLGRNEEAAADFTHALEYRPDDPDALSNRAVMYVRLDRLVSAREDLDRAIAADPTRPRLYVLRGGVQQQLGDERRACDDWELACRLGDCRMLQEQCPARLGRIGG
jgi:tetratricopeptide (TPR) repeat protein